MGFPFGSSAGTDLAGSLPISRQAIVTWDSSLDGF
jgi:hypothetical protein